ncbi:APA2 [Candida pseudojiufengensis]|uniref:APA2 n=1 Tax=Candida pseudojiufengensis TaxID=497109 RepID=UPI0022246AF5|nr:APA2 [Candida pseudojiufengensis]KAI5963212.1 APA2 [Candida pseudojiufengensis]
MSNEGYDLRDDFYETLSKKYDDALISKHILYNGESVVNEIIQFPIDDKHSANAQLTLLTSLMHRPENNNKKNSENNPFEKPEPELTILDDYGANKELKLVFNKYPVNSKHFLLVTKKYSSQNSPLLPTELLATYTILEKLDKLKPEGEDWFAFYNCGPESGASQAHKHIQFMTLPPKQEFISYPEILIENNLFENNANNKLHIQDANEPLENKNLPFSQFIMKLPKNKDEITEDVLTKSFTSLLQHTLTVLRNNETKHISYNFVMTTEFMLMVPRSKSKFDDQIGINSCGVYGLLLCKNQELFNTVREVGILKILQEVCLPNSGEFKFDEYSY